MYICLSDEHVTWEMPSEYEMPSSECAPHCDGPAATRLDPAATRSEEALGVEEARSAVRTS